jgi:hypothetical protein
MVPHQGSTSSTSDGILKVFEKALSYQKTTSNEFPVTTVVLLDEVGLAETSPHNPLKVLHELLEPSNSNDGPSVAVIGISNWRLDNSKSSRALLVQRPRFDMNDLVDTAEALLKENNRLPYIFSSISSNRLRELALAYLNYEQKQKYQNFHGM